MWKIKVNVRGARHLPKMDAVGACDGFVKVKLGPHQTFQTKVVAKSFDPIWDESFELNCGGVHGHTLRLEVYDQDIQKFRKVHELVGCADVNLESMLHGHDGSQTAEDHTEAKTVHIQNRQGDSCIGDDNMQTELDMSITVIGFDHVQAQQ